MEGRFSAQATVRSHGAWKAYNADAKKKISNALSLNYSSYRTFTSSGYLGGQQDLFGWVMMWL